MNIVDSRPEVIALCVLSKFINAILYLSFRTYQVLILGFTNTNLILNFKSFHTALKVLVNVFIVISNKFFLYIYNQQLFLTAK